MAKELLDNELRKPYKTPVFGMFKHNPWAAYRLTRLCHWVLLMRPKLAKCHKKIFGWMRGQRPAMRNLFSRKPYKHCYANCIQRRHHDSRRLVEPNA